MKLHTCRQVPAASPQHLTQQFPPSSATKSPSLRGKMDSNSYVQSEFSVCSISHCTFVFMCLPKFLVARKKMLFHSASHHWMSPTFWQFYMFPWLLTAQDAAWSAASAKLFFTPPAIFILSDVFLTELLKSWLICITSGGGDAIPRKAHSFTLVTAFQQVSWIGRNRIHATGGWWKQQGNNMRTF